MMAVSVQIFHLLLKSKAALHASAPCPSVMSSGRESSPSRGGRSFCSKWTSKVELMLQTTEREDTKKTTVSTASSVFTQGIPTESLSSCCFNRRDLWFRMQS